MLREYTKHLHFLGRDDYSTARIAYSPYLFTDEELKKLFDGFDNYCGFKSGKRNMPELILPVYSRLLYCCGMRPNEPTALLRADVKLDSGDVYIRQSKRNKDRHILMSSDMLALCRRYDELAGEREWFFQSYSGWPFDTHWFTRMFNHVWDMVGLPGRGNPRPYDLRHAFASRNIIRWLEAGRDSMELLTYLSAYMGHSELSSTLYYIHLLPDRLRRAAGVNWEMLGRVYGGATDMRTKLKDPKLLSCIGEFLNNYLPSVKTRDGDTIGSYRVSFNMFLLYLKSTSGLTLRT